MIEALAMFPYISFNSSSSSCIAYEWIYRKLFNCRSAEYSLPLKRDLERARKDLAMANHRLQESLHSSETLSEEIERLKRVSAAAREGDRVEKVALEARCVRGSELMEAEILLRRQVESKAAKHDRLEAEYNRLVIEVSRSHSHSSSLCPILSCLVLSCLVLSYPVTHCFFDCYSRSNTQ